MSVLRRWLSIRPPKVNIHIGKSTGVFGPLLRGIFHLRRIKYWISSILIREVLNIERQIYFLVGRFRVTVRRGRAGLQFQWYRLWTFLWVDPYDTD